MGEPTRPPRAARCGEERGARAGSDTRHVIDFRRFSLSRRRSASRASGPRASRQCRNLTSFGSASSARRGGRPRAHVLVRRPGRCALRPSRTLSPPAARPARRDRLLLLLLLVVFPAEVRARPRRRDAGHESVARGRRHAPRRRSRVALVRPPPRPRAPRRRGAGPGGLDRRVRHRHRGRVGGRRRLARRDRGRGGFRAQHGMVCPRRRRVPPREALVRHRERGGGGGLAKRSGGHAGGFTASKALWLKRNEPGAFGATAAVALRLSSTSNSRARSPPTPATPAWARSLSDAAAHHSPPGDSLPRHDASHCAAVDARFASMLPEILPADAVVGVVSAAGARLFGLPRGIPISIGSGDNMMAALGAGCVSEGTLVCSLGTSGTLSAAPTRPRASTPPDRWRRSATPPAGTSPCSAPSTAPGSWRRRGRSSARGGPTTSSARSPRRFRRGATAFGSCRTSSASARPTGRKPRARSWGSARGA